MTARRETRIRQIRRDRDDRGAFLIIWALLLTALITMAAIAIDLESLRLDRRADRLASDSSVLAAAATLSSTAADRYNACVSAWNYAARNVGQTSLVSNTPTACAPFSAVTATSCSDSSPSSAVPSVATGTMGPYTFTFTTPVLDTDPLITSSDAIGGGVPQAVDTSSAKVDGTACQRVGVSLLLTRNPFFGGVIGAKAKSTTVHSVARRVNGTTKIPASVVLLDPTDCGVLNDNSNAGSIVVQDGSSPPTQAGTIVVVSTADDPTTCAVFNTNNDYEVEAKATPKGIYVVGNMYLGGYTTSPCPSSGASHPCNQANIGCAKPASICIQDFTTRIAINPLAIPTAVDRSVVDDIFNCRSTYSSGLSMPTPYNPPRSTSPLASCPSATSSTDYINAYVAAMKAATNPFLVPSGVGSTTTSGGGCPSATPSVALTQTVVNTYKYPSCQFTGAAVVNGNLELGKGMKSGNLIVNGNAVFDDTVALGNGDSLLVTGNAEFKGGVTMTGGSIAITSTIPAGTPSTGTASAYTCDWSSGYGPCVGSSGNDFHTVFLDPGASGGIGMTGGALNFDHTFVYAGYDPSTKNAADLSLKGGGGITWNPPTTGPFSYPIPGTSAHARLSLWSDGIGTGLTTGTNTHVQQLAGGGTVAMSGTYFTPGDCWNLTGGNNIGTGTAVTAQFIAYCMVQGGTSTFQLTPNVDSVQVPVAAGPQLIR